MPSPLVFSESIIGPKAGALPCFGATQRQGGRDAVWMRVTSELDIATAPQLQQTLRKAQLHARRVVVMWTRIGQLGERLRDQPRAGFRQIALDRASPFLKCVDRLQLGGGS